jgi:hypothetical protein
MSPSEVYRSSYLSDGIRSYNFHVPATERAPRKDLACSQTAPYKCLDDWCLIVLVVIASSVSMPLSLQNLALLSPPHFFTKLKHKLSSSCKILQNLLYRYQNFLDSCEFFHPITYQPWGLFRVGGVQINAVFDGRRRFLPFFGSRVVQISSVQMKRSATIAIPCLSRKLHFLYLHGCLYRLESLWCYVRLSDRSFVDYCVGHRQSTRKRGLVSWEDSLHNFYRVFLSRWFSPVLRSLKLGSSWLRAVSSHSPFFPTALHTPVNCATKKIIVSCLTHRTSNLPWVRSKRHIIGQKLS